MRKNLSSKNLDDFSITQYHNPSFSEADIYTFPKILKIIFSSDKLLSQEVVK